MSKSKPSVASNGRLSPEAAEAIRRNPPQVLNLKEGAAFLCVSLSTVEQEVAAGRLKSFLARRRRLLRLVDVNDYVSRRVS
jgi:predicted DNA-binding protein (UPF0251 family)